MIKDKVSEDFKQKVLSNNIKLTLHYDTKLMKQRMDGVRSQLERLALVTSEERQELEALARRVNGLLLELGIIDQYIIWLGEPRLALLMVVLADVWKETSFIMLLFLAALQTRLTSSLASCLGDGHWSTI